MYPRIYIALLSFHSLNRQRNVDRFRSRARIPRDRCVLTPEQIGFDGPPRRVTDVTITVLNPLKIKSTFDDQRAARADVDGYGLHANDGANNARSHADLIKRTGDRRRQKSVPNCSGYTVAKPRTWRTD